MVRRTLLRCQHLCLKWKALLVLVLLVLVPVLLLLLLCNTLLLEALLLKGEEGRRPEWSPSRRLYGSGLGSPRRA